MARLIIYDKPVLSPVPELTTRIKRMLADHDVCVAAENFVQQWVAHPRDIDKIGHDHAELIRTVLNRRVAHGEQ